MPVHMAEDVGSILGADAGRCKSPSLYADKFPDLPGGENDKEARKRSIDRLVRLQPDVQGLELKTGFLNDLLRRGCPALSFAAKLGARLIVNQAGGVIENAGLCLDRHFGHPFLPGSALKGISRAAAREAGADARQMLAVFGWCSGDRLAPEPLRKMSYAGSVSFLPAHPLEAARLGLDIVTCHHPGYYRNDQVRQALDTEAPIPNPFPVVEAGAVFRFALVAAGTPTRRRSVLHALGLPVEFDLLSCARDWLILALTEHGAGAKTSAGFGWFEFDAAAERRQQEEELQLRHTEEEKARQKMDQERREAEEQARLAAMGPVERARLDLAKMGDEQFAGFARELPSKTLGEQRAFCDLLRGEKKERWKVWRKKKPQLAEIVLGVAAKINEVLT